MYYKKYFIYKENDFLGSKSCVQFFALMIGFSYVYLLPRKKGQI